MSDATAADGDIFKYDGVIISQMNRLEDSITKFALQNYTTSGAVFLAYFGSSKIPPWAALIVIVVVNMLFMLAIAHTAYRYKLLCSMHHVTRNCWLAQKPHAYLLQALKDNPNSKQVLETEIPSFERFRDQLELNHPAVYANLLPTFAALLLLFAPPP